MHLLPTAHLRRIAWRLKDRRQPAKSFQRFRVLRALVGEDATRIELRICAALLRGSKTTTTVPFPQAVGKFGPRVQTSVYGTGNGLVYRI